MSLGDGIGDEPVDIEPVDSSEPAEFDDFCLAFVDNSPPDIVFGRSFVSFIFRSIISLFVIVVFFDLTSSFYLKLSFLCCLINLDNITLN